MTDAWGLLILQDVILLLSLRTHGLWVSCQWLVLGLGGGFHSWVLPFLPPVITGQSRLSRKVAENEIPNCIDTTGMSPFYEGATLTAVGSTFALNKLQQKWINTFGYNGTRMILLGLEIHCYKRCFAIMKKKTEKKSLLDSLRNMILCIQEVTIKLIQKFMVKRVSFMLCVLVQNFMFKQWRWLWVKPYFHLNLSKLRGHFRKKLGIGNLLMIAQTGRPRRRHCRLLFHD